MLQISTFSVAACVGHTLLSRSVAGTGLLVVVVAEVVVVTFFNHNFVNCKATLILAIKIYEIKYNISLNDIHTYTRPLFP